MEVTMGGSRVDGQRAVYEAWSSVSFLHAS